MKQLESFGAIKHYRDLILLVQHDRYLWQKVAHILNKLRRHLHPWAFVDRTNQIKSAREYLLQALNDTKMPGEVKCLLQRGIYTEFGINTFPEQD